MRNSTIHVLSVAWLLLSACDGPPEGRGAATAADFSLVAGRVTVDGQALAGAHVRLVAGDHEDEQRTDDDGRFELLTPEGRSARVEVYRDGERVTWLDAEAGAFVTMDLGVDRDRLFGAGVSHEGALSVARDPSAPDASSPYATAEEALGVCVRVPWGPGKVNWGMSSPKSSGYSVAPESTSRLVWGAAPSQDIDAIYRHAWGCGVAYKVPNHCTATVRSSGGISCCCNAAASLVGGSCRWIDTRANSVDGNYFADCPL